MKNKLIAFLAGFIWGIFSVGMFMSAIQSIPAGEVEAQQKASLLQKADCESENTKLFEESVGSLSNIATSELQIKCTSESYR